MGIFIYGAFLPDEVTPEHIRIRYLNINCSIKMLVLYG